MLGYTLDELNNMIEAQRIMLITIDQSKMDKEFVSSLNQTFHFLQGLWAEGYFD